MAGALGRCAIYASLMLYGMGGSQAQEISAPSVAVANPFEATADFHLLATMKVWQPGDPVKRTEDLEEEGGRQPRPGRTLQPSQADPLLAQQTLAGAAPNVSIVASFDGIPATGYVPPDVTSAVGPNHIIQMGNVAFAIFDKAGKLLAGPSPINSVWAGFGGPCESENAGDPVVRYDHFADRWLISQFAIDEHFQCIAISKGADPVQSGWYLYAFPTNDADGKPVTPDYPKIAVWPDGYYMGTQRGFPDGGLDVWVFERDKMLAGKPARQVHFSVGPPSLFLMPADVDGPPPADGSPEVFLRHVDGQQFGGHDRLELYAFQTKWDNPDQSRFAKLGEVGTSEYNEVLCNDMFSAFCVPQPGTDIRLETLPVWTMWRAQYRNFGDHQTLVVNHTVNADGHDRAGIRWYELRKNGSSSWNKFQEGTFSPDSLNRWMGSIAMDAGGNIALGYSASSNSVFPSLRVATRSPSDKIGFLSMEFVLQQGSGSQTSNPSRWGDYSSMEVDPRDSCTFWYTGEYYPSTTEVGWRTRVVGFKLPSCK